MAITLTQFATSFPGSAATHTVTFGSAVTTGNSVVILAGSRHHVVSVSDNKGNVYTRDQIRNQDGACVSIWRISNCVGGANFTVTFTMFAPVDLDVLMQEVGCILTPLSGTTNTGFIPSTALFEITPGAALSHNMPVLSWGGNAMDQATRHSHSGSVGYSNVGNQVNGMTSFDWAYDVFSSAGSRRPTWFCGVAGSVFAAAHQLYYEPVSANFTATPLSGTAPLIVVFTDASAGSPTSWFWQFGDGQLSTEQHPTVNYTIPGVYSPHLTVRRANVPDGTLQRDNYITIDDGGPPPPPVVAPASPTEAVAKPVLMPVASGGSSVRVERAGRTLSQIVNSLVRQGMVPRRSDTTFGLITGGFASELAPTASDDVADGARSGTFWVEDQGDGEYAVYVNLKSDSGEAIWVEVSTEQTRISDGGLSGTF